MPVFLTNLLPSTPVSPSLNEDAMFTRIKVLENKPPFGNSAGEFILPLPKEMEGANVFSMDWQQESLGGDFLNNLLTRLFTSSENAEGGTVGHFVTDTIENMGGGGLAAALNRDSGTAKNPINTLLFKAPNLRQFQFTWDFMPIDAGRASKVKDAINQLRTYMHPTYGGSGYLTPNLFEVEIKVFQNTLFKSIPAALTSLAVNPYGSGVPSFHADGAPVHTTLTLEFQEVIGLVQSNVQKLYPS